MLTSLYRFFSNEAHNLDGLANNYLWFSHLKDFNDPFEGIFLHQYAEPNYDDLSDAKIVELYTSLHKGTLPKHIIQDNLAKGFLQNTIRKESIELMNRTLEKVNLLSNRHINDKRFCCLVKDDVDVNKKVLKNKLMWSHYSDGFRGFCVEFNRELLIDSVCKSLGEPVGIIEICYEGLKKYNIWDLIIDSATDPSQGVGKLVTLKSPEWSYENEFRLTSEGKNIVNYSFKSVNSIIFSERMPEPRKKTVMAIILGLVQAYEHEIKFKEAYLDSDTLDIEIRDLVN
ncbi:DUF2971 domain-containing protein [Vibrio fluvialis]|nr:DUF2971 domain-containing protein [Vibrio fluvialis]